MNSQKHSFRNEFLHKLASTFRKLTPFNLISEHDLFDHFRYEYFIADKRGQSDWNIVMFTYYDLHHIMSEDDLAMSTLISIIFPKSYDENDRAFFTTYKTSDTTHVFSTVSYNETPYIIQDDIDSEHNVLKDFDEGMIEQFVPLPIEDIDYITNTDISISSIMFKPFANYLYNNNILTDITAKYVETKYENVSVYYSQRDVNNKKNFVYAKDFDLEYIRNNENIFRELYNLYVSIFKYIFDKMSRLNREEYSENESNCEMSCSDTNSDI